MCVAACVAYARGLTNHIARPNRTKNMSTADNQLNKVTPVSYELMNAVHFFHSFSHSYFLKPSTIETKIFVLLLNQEGHHHLRRECYTASHLSVKLDMPFIHSPTREIKIYLRSCMVNSKRNFKLLCHKLSSSLKYIKVRMALHVFNPLEPSLRYIGQLSHPHFFLSAVSLLDITRPQSANLA